ncbi:hypothetical protein ABZ769_28150 [Streptomyces olivoreticuli]
MSAEAGQMDEFLRRAAREADERRAELSRKVAEANKQSEAIRR